MKKLMLSTFVIALFAMGFTASSSEDSDEVMEYKGEKMHKVHLKCAKCDTETYYWKSESSSLTLEKPQRMYQGQWYCTLHYPD